GGSGGADVVYLTGAGNGETMTLRPHSGELRGPGYEVDVSSMTSIYDFGGGNDAAFLYDAPGNDVLVSTPTYSYLAGSGFLNLVSGFATAYGFSQAGGSDA